VLAGIDAPGARARRVRGSSDVGRVSFGAAVHNPVLQLGTVNLGVQVGVPKGDRPSRRSVVLVSPRAGAAVQPSGRR
jgi:hypothetical protein